jgi:small subunit ribosomal protein S1
MVLATMSDETPTSSQSAPENGPSAEPNENFADILSDFERSHVHRPDGRAKQLHGTVIWLSAERVFLDIGYKIEGVLQRSIFANNAEDVKPGDVIPVSVTGRNEDGYYELSRFNVARPHDWTALEAAFAQKLAVAGTVTGVVKGGLTVDVGVRAFMPASRSGARDSAEMEQLVGTEISCRITKLDVTDEDVVVDRRLVLEEQARAEAERRLSLMSEGDTVTGTVRSLMSYGAFIDIGGADGLLHVSDLAWGHVHKPEDMLTVGQQIRVRILKIDPETKKISLGLKQLEPEPWETAPAKYRIGERVYGTVTRLADFGAFVEIEPGVEGLIHISEMSWGKKVHHPGDVVHDGDRVEAVILDIKPQERRIALGLKQTLNDPWLDVPRKYPAGSQIEGPVTKLTKFGAFVEIAEGIEGLVHISEMVADRRLNHPSEVLRAGQVVKAQVLGIDAEKRQIKLSMKRLVPTSIDEYVVEHKLGDVVSGRVSEVLGALVTVELGQGVRGVCRVTDARSGFGRPGQDAEDIGGAMPAKDAPSLSALTSMLQARWKGNTAKAEPLRDGQIRSFKIVSLDVAAKKIEVEPA